MQRIIRTEFLDCTDIAIAHRLNIILDFDRIAVIDHGVLVEFDEPQILLSRKGAFKDLYEHISLRRERKMGLWIRRALQLVMGSRPRDKSAECNGYKNSREIILAFCWIATKSERSLVVICVCFMVSSLEAPGYWLRFSPNHLSYLPAQNDVCRHRFVNFILFFLD